MKFQPGPAFDLANMSKVATQFTDNGAVTGANAGARNKLIGAAFGGQEQASKVVTELTDKGAVTSGVKPLLGGLEKLTEDAFQPLKKGGIIPVTQEVLDRRLVRLENEVIEAKQLHDFDTFNRLEQQIEKTRQDKLKY